MKTTTRIKGFAAFEILMLLIFSFHFGWKFVLGVFVALTMEILAITFCLDYICVSKETRP
jgi:amino acid permease